MSIEKRVAIIRGIAIPEKGEHNYKELLAQFLKDYPDSQIVRYAISGNYLDPNNIDVDDFDEFLIEQDLLIEDTDALDHAYIGYIIEHLNEQSGAIDISNYISAEPLSREGRTQYVKMIGEFIDTLEIMWGTGDWCSDENITEKTYLVQWWF